MIHEFVVIVGVDHIVGKIIGALDVVVVIIIFPLVIVIIVIIILIIFIYICLLVIFVIGRNRYHLIGCIIPIIASSSLQCRDPQESLE